jgi:hypothetical protein
MDLRALNGGGDGLPGPAPTSSIHSRPGEDARTNRAPGTICQGISLNT